MFKDIPPRANQTADTEEEGWRYSRDKNAKRPPAPDPRPRGPLHSTEVREGRQSSGGVSDIAWIKERIPNAAEHIKKKLPACITSSTACRH
jgi:succinate dehydrogenase / fumarate reductase flavoprotein subunit